MLVITARALEQTPCFSNNEQQNIKNKAQKGGQFSYAESLIDFKTAGEPSPRLKGVALASMKPNSRS